MSLVAIFLIAGVLERISADTIRVPKDYASIQAAINAASAGDTVLVGACCVEIDEQAKHQGRRILTAARPSFIDLGLAQIEQADRFHDEMYQVILRHPLPEIRGHQQWRIAVNTDELGTDA